MTVLMVAAKVVEAGVMEEVAEAGVMEEVVEATVRKDLNQRPLMYVLSS
jgi:hypothetical protein